MMLHTGEASEMPPSRLPMGDPDHNYEVFITVRICYDQSACAAERVSLIIKSLTEGYSDKDSRDILTKYLGLSAKELAQLTSASVTGCDSLILAIHTVLQMCFNNLFPLKMVSPLPSVLEQFSMILQPRATRALTKPHDFR